MHSSVTSGSASRGRSARSVRSSAESSPPAGAVAAGAPIGAREKASAAGVGSMQLIYRPEIDVARHQHLDALAVALDDGGRDAERVLEHLGEHLLAPRGRIGTPDP